MMKPALPVLAIAALFAASPNNSPTQAPPIQLGARKTVGRNGTGPNEYQTPFGPIRWKGDTLLGHDPNNRRALRIAQDGSVIGTIPLAQPRMEGINGWGAARAVDSQGRIYWDLPIIEREPAIKRSTKAQIVRWQPGVESPEHVMYFADHGEFEYEFRFRPIPQTDAWVMDRAVRLPGDSEVATALKRRWCQNRDPSSRPRVHIVWPDPLRYATGTRISVSSLSGGVFVGLLT